MKQQKNVEAAFALLKEAVRELRPLSLSGSDADIELFLLCLKCELSLHKALVGADRSNS